MVGNPCDSDLHNWKNQAVDAAVYVDRNHRSSKTGVHASAGAEMSDHLGEVSRISVFAADVEGYSRLMGGR
jgi:hypothetical protein